MPLVVLCEVLCLFLLTYTSALSLHWPERQSRVADTTQCWKRPSSEAWDLVTGSSSSYLPPLCYRVSKKASKPHEQIHAGLVQSSTHGRDQTRLNTRDRPGLSSSWNLPPRCHWCPGHHGSLCRRRWKGKTAEKWTASWWCLYPAGWQGPSVLSIQWRYWTRYSSGGGGRPTASYFPNQRLNLHPSHWQCEVLPQDHRRSPWTVTCLFNTNISWFWRVALRGDSSYILEKSIYSVLTGYIFEDHNCAFPLLKIFCIPSCIYWCWEISRHSDSWCFAWKCSSLRNFSLQLTRSALLSLFALLHFQSACLAFCGQFQPKISYHRILEDFLILVVGKSLLLQFFVSFYETTVIWILPFLDLSSNYLLFPSYFLYL